MDRAEAVTAERKRVGHHAQTVLPNIESKLAWVRPLGGGVRNYHLGEGRAVHDRAGAALLLVEVLDGAEDDSLAVLKKREHIRCREKRKGGYGTAENAR